MFKPACRTAGNGHDSFDCGGGSRSDGHGDRGIWRQRREACIIGLLHAFHFDAVVSHGVCLVYPPTIAVRFSRLCILVNLIVTIWYIRSVYCIFLLRTTKCVADDATSSTRFASVVLLLLRSNS